MAKKISVCLPLYELVTGCRTRRRQEPGRRFEREASIFIAAVFRDVGDFLRIFLTQRTPRLARRLAERLISLRAFANTFAASALNRQRLSGLQSGRAVP